jgi:hypothetical protein
LRDARERQNETGTDALTSVPRRKLSDFARSNGPLTIETRRGSRIGSDESEPDGALPRDLPTLDATRRRATASDTGESGGSGTSVTRSDILRQSTEEEGVGEERELCWKSTGQQINIVVESAASMSLIDSSVEQLHTLMKSAAKRAETEPKAEMVNAAAACAKQIAGLIRLKLDIVKELRRTSR